VHSRAAELLLAAADESGVLDVFVLWRELAELAGDREFTAREAVAHARLPANARLLAAIEAVCGEVSPRKLGKQLALWEGARIASLRIDRIGDDAAGLLWRVSRGKPFLVDAQPRNGATIASDDHR
jgi:hypothetical protein